jgi:branched-chain amino acid aminotransferase
MFGVGTACVVCPVEALLYKDRKHVLPTMTSGAKTMNRVMKQLLDIQYGRTQHEWSTVVD